MQKIASRLSEASRSCIAAANQGGGKGGQTNNQAAQAQAIAQKAAINQPQAGEEQAHILCSNTLSIMTMIQGSIISTAHCYCLG
jgi:hypothetical protein